MDYQLIKVCHLAGIMLLFIGLGGMVFAARVGLGPEQRGLRRAAMMIHGIALLLILASGIAMAVQGGWMHGDPPNWIKGKFVIWLLLGGSISLAARASKRMSVWIPLWVLLGATAAYLAIYKPL